MAANVPTPQDDSKKRKRSWGDFFANIIFGEHSKQAEEERLKMADLRRKRWDDEQRNAKRLKAANPQGKTPPQIQNTEPQGGAAAAKGYTKPQGAAAEGDTEPQGAAGYYDEEEAGAAAPRTRGDPELGISHISASAAKNDVVKSPHGQGLFQEGKSEVNYAALLALSATTDARTMTEAGKLSREGMDAQLDAERKREKQNQNASDHGIRLKVIKGPSRAITLSATSSNYKKLDLFFRDHTLLPLENMSFFNYDPSNNIVSEIPIENLPVGADSRLAIFWHIDENIPREDDLTKFEHFEAFSGHLKKLCSLGVFNRLLQACVKERDIVAPPAAKATFTELKAASALLLAFFGYRASIQGVLYTYSLVQENPVGTYTLQKTLDDRLTFVCTVDCTAGTKTDWETPSSSILSWFKPKKEPPTLPPLAELIACCLVVGGADNRYMYEMPGQVRSLVLTGRRPLHTDVKNYTLTFYFNENSSTGSKMTRRP